MKNLLICFAFALVSISARSQAFTGRTANNCLFMRYTDTTGVVPVIGNNTVAWIFRTADSTLYRWTNTHKAWTAYGVSGSTPNIATVLNSASQSANATWNLGGHTLALSGISKDTTNSYGPLVQVKDSTARSVSWSDAASEMNLTSGVYLPTATDIAGNTSAITVDSAKWTRTGNIITVSGHIIVTASSNSASEEIDLSLAVASQLNSAANGFLGGGFSAASESTAGIIITGDGTNHKAQLDYTSGSSSSGVSKGILYTYTYEIQ